MSSLFCPGNDLLNLGPGHYASQGSSKVGLNKTLDLKGKNSYNSIFNSKVPKSAVFTL